MEILLSNSVILGEDALFILYKATIYILNDIF